MKKTNVFGRIFGFIKENISYVIMLIATLMALTFIVAMTFGSFYNNIKNNAVTIGNMTVTDEAKRINDSLTLGLNTLQMASLTIDYMIEQGVSPADMEKYLIRESDEIQKNIDPSFSGIYGVVDDIYIDGLGWVPDDDYDPYSRPWYLAAKEKSGSLAIISPYIDAQTNSIMISFSKMLSDGVNALSMDKKMDDIYTAARVIQLNGNGYCFVVDRKGLVVAHRDENEMGKNYLSGESEMSGVVQKVYSSDADVINMDIGGSDCMVFAESVQDEWYVVLVVDSADLFKDIRKSLVQNIFISLVIFLLVGYFCTSNYFNRKKAIRYADDVRTDDLTGLNNRGEFDRYLNVTISGITNDKKLYLMLFDADNFKSINDKHGHPEGDKALKYIAKAMMNACHGTDWFCARYGGDEFVIVCKCKDDNTVRRIAEDIDSRLKEIMDINKLPYVLALSYGFAEYHPETQTITELIDNADHSLYLMKAEKRKQRSENEKITT